MCVEESVHIIFCETNFMTSEQDTNNFKIGLANLEDDEDVMKEQDQRTVGEQLIQEQIEVPDNTKQLVNEDQQAVPNTAVLRNKQTNPAENEQNKNQVNDPEPTTVPTREFVPKPWRYQKCHPLDLIVSDLNERTQTKSQMRNFYAHFAFLSTLEPKNHEEALKDSEWIIAMQDELNEFERNKV